jgi:branched-chain amino acid transport system permease protein
MVTTIWAGLTVGAIYALVGLGYTVTFIGSAAFNFAQASFVMTGVYIAYLGLDHWKVPAVGVILLATGAVSLLSVIVQQVAVAPVRSHDSLLVTTVGAATLIDGVAQRLAGDQPLQVSFIFSNHPTTVFSGRVLPGELWLIVMVPLIALFLTVISRRTLVGMAGLAVSADNDAARLFGINPKRYAIGSFALAGAIAGLMGVFVGPETSAFATLSSAIALKGFVALALGGFRSFFGAALGGFACGLSEAFVARYLGSEYQTLAVFALLLLTLLLFPTGLLGERKVRTV